MNQNHFINQQFRIIENIYGNENNNNLIIMGHQHNIMNQN